MTTVCSAGCYIPDNYKDKLYALGHKVLIIICRGERLEQMLCKIAVMVACKSHSDHI